MSKVSTSEDCSSPGLVERGGVNVARTSAGGWLLGQVVYPAVSSYECAVHMGSSRRAESLQSLRRHGGNPGIEPVARGIEGPTQVQIQLSNWSSGQRSQCLPE